MAAKEVQCVWPQVSPKREFLEQNAGKLPRTVCPMDKTRNVKAEAWRDRDGVTEDIVGEFVSVEGQG